MTTTIDFQAMFGERAAEVDRALDHKSGTFSKWLHRFLKKVAEADAVHNKLGISCQYVMQISFEELRDLYPNGLPSSSGMEWASQHMMPAIKALVDATYSCDAGSFYKALATATIIFVEGCRAWECAQKIFVLMIFAAAHMKTTEDNLRPHLEMLLFPHLQVNLPEHISESTPRLAGKPGLAQLCSLANDMQQITSRPVDAWVRTVFDQASGITLMGSRLLVLRDELHAEPRFCVQQWLAYLQSSLLSFAYAEHGLALQLNIEQGLASLVPIPGYPNAEYEAFPIMVMPFHLANKTPWLASMQSCKGLLPLGSNIVG